jgi:Subtilase family
MNWNFSSIRSVLFTISFILGLILVGSAFQTSAQTPQKNLQWKWAPDEATFKNLKPGVAYDTDTILAIFRLNEFREKVKENKLKNSNAKPFTDSDFLNRLLKRANLIFKRKVGTFFSLIIDKKIKLDSIGYQLAEVCSDGNILLRFRISSSKFNLKNRDLSPNNYDLVRKLIESAVAAIAAASEEIDPDHPYVVSADYINFPLPNGSQIPTDSTVQELKNDEKSWPLVKAFGTLKPEIPDISDLKEVTVAVLDTGTTYDPLSGPFIFDPFCTNTTNKDDKCLDEYGQEPSRKQKIPLGHGAGIARIINDKEFGVANGVSVRYVKVCSYDPSLKGSECPTEAVVEALCKTPLNLNWPDPKDGPKEYRVPPQIINLSLGGYFPSEIIKRTLSDLANANILVVTAAGNTRNLKRNANAQPGEKNWDFTDFLINPKEIFSGLPIYPAQYASENLVVAVGATDRNNDFYKNGTVNGYVTLAAPGVQVTTVQSTLKNKASTDAQFTGTSFAAPYVSGAAALLIAKYKGLHSNQNPSRDLLIRYLRRDLSVGGTPNPIRPNSCPILDQCGIQLNISESLKLVR